MIYLRVIIRPVVQKTKTCIYLSKFLSFHVFLKTSLVNCLIDIRFYLGWLIYLVQVLQETLRFSASTFSALMNFQVFVDKALMDAVANFILESLNLTKSCVSNVKVRQFSHYIRLMKQEPLTFFIFLNGLSVWSIGNYIPSRYVYIFYHILAYLNVSIQYTYAHFASGLSCQ